MKTTFKLSTNNIRGRVEFILFSLLLTSLTLGIDLGTALSYEERSNFEGGSVTGKVSLNGTLPQPRRYNLVLFPDPYYCGRISDGKGWRLSPFMQSKLNEGVPGVIVYFKNIKWGKPLQFQQHNILAKNCEFLPYLNHVSQGETLIFENWDPVPHDIEVYEYSDRGGKFLFRQPLRRNPKIRKSDFLTEGIQAEHLPGPGVAHKILTMGPLVFRCSFHEYMEAWGFVLDHPYFSFTGESGEFSITNIPPGKYQLVVWHPLGQMEKYIDIIPSGTLNLDLEFTPTSPIIYEEDNTKPNSFGIDLIGDSQIVPTVELQKWDDPLVLPKNPLHTPSHPGVLP